MSLNNLSNYNAIAIATANPSDAPPATDVKDTFPTPSVDRTCPDVPSAVGNEYAPLTLTVPVVWIPVAVVSNFLELL